MSGDERKRRDSAASALEYVSAAESAGLRELLERREEDLRLAAELGEVLLEKNGEAEARAEELAARAEALEEDVTRAESELAAERAARKRAQVAQKRLEFQLEEVQARCEEAEGAVGREKERRMRLRSSFNAAEATLGVETAAAAEERREMQAKLSAAEAAARHRTDVAADLEAQLGALTGELAEARAAAEGRRAAEAAAERLRGEVERLSKDTHLLADMRWEHEQLGQAMRSLEKENRFLQGQVRELNEMLGEERRQRNEAAAVTAQAAPRPSLFEEMGGAGAGKGGSSSEAEASPAPDLARLKHMRAQSWASTTSSSSESGGGSGSERGGGGGDPTLAGRDAQMEYFFLSVLACKLNMGTRMQAFFKRSSRSMYTEAVQANVPFHQYATFIENALMRDYIEAKRLQARGGDSGRPATAAAPTHLAPPSASMISFVSSVMGPGSARAMAARHSRAPSAAAPPLGLAIHEAAGLPSDCMAEPASPLAAVLTGAGGAAAGGGPSSPASADTERRRREPQRRRGRFMRWLSGGTA